MKNLLLCFVILISGVLNAMETTPDITDINYCLDAAHPSGLNLEKIKERSQLMYGNSEDLSIKVITYLNLKNKLRNIFKESVVIDSQNTTLVNILMSKAVKLKIEICTRFAICEAQLLLIEEATPLAEAPSLKDCLDANAACGLNLTLVCKRERILRLHGIADDPATYIILYRETIAALKRENNGDQKFALLLSLQQLLQKISQSNLGLSSEQICALDY